MASLKSFIHSVLFGNNSQIISKGIETEILRNGSIYSCIATMPRSGTWMTKYFFHAYNSFLSENNVGDHHLPDFNHYQNIGVAGYHSHTIFPDIYSVCPEKYKHEWDQLNFYIEGYNGGYNFIDLNKDKFFASLNPKSKYVYIYRNPLDQCVSYFEHGKNHKDENHTYIIKDGERHYFRDANDFVINAGISSYLKQFLSYYLVNKKYEDTLMMVTYEELVRHPEESYRKILRFLDHDILQHNDDHLFRALNFIKAENLRAHELKAGRSLANDQKNHEESHMRGGKIGKWKNILSENTLTYVERGLGKFDLSIDFFIIE